MENCQEKPQSEYDSSMAHISKHESKQEREGSNRDDSRINLLVIGSTIHVNNHMERHREVI